MRWIALERNGFEKRVPDPCETETIEEIDRRLSDLKRKAFSTMSHWKALQGEIQAYEKERERLQNEKHPEAKQV